MISYYHPAGLFALSGNKLTASAISAGSDAKILGKRRKDCYLASTDAGKADIDAVDICTIHDQHEAQVLAAAKAGKQIFLESRWRSAFPVPQDGRAAAKAGVTFMVGHDLRYMPGGNQTNNQRRTGVGKLTRCTLK